MEGYFCSKLELNLPVATVKKITGLALIAIALKMMIKG
jgi:hypothetical protein